ncbi:MAG TPA: diaminopimelate epimerase [Acidimicrobiales bacterium]
MRLTKHHGLGNDFLVVLDPDASHPLDADLARALCDRHTGVGADGILRATPTAPGGPARARMELRNADGSRAETSGNGIRCLAQALLLGGWPGAAGATEVAIETDAGLRTVTVHDRVDGVTHDLSVAMGAARVDGEAPEWTGGGVTRALLVDMGNPHLVLDLSAGAAGDDGPGDDESEVDLVTLGEAVNAKVAGGANVHLLTTTAAPGIAVRTYERGVGPTLACGTGACASAVAARRWGMAGDRVAVDMPGGRAEVTLGATDRDPAVLRGPAVFVAEIELGASPWR